LVRVTVQSSPNPSLPGQSVTFHIFVDPVFNFVDPTGSIQVFEGISDLGMYPLNLDQTSLTRVFTYAGAHVLSVVYSGDTNYCSNAIAFGQPVNRITSTLTLSSSAPSSTFGA